MFCSLLPSGSNSVLENLCTLPLLYINTEYPSRYSESPIYHPVYEISNRPCIGRCLFSRKRRRSQSCLEKVCQNESKSHLEILMSLLSLPFLEPPTTWSMLSTLVSDVASLSSLQVPSNSSMAQKLIQRSTHSALSLSPAPVWTRKHLCLKIPSISTIIFFRAISDSNIVEEPAMTQNLSFVRHVLLRGFLRLKYPGGAWHVSNSPSMPIWSGPRLLLLKQHRHDSMFPVLWIGQRCYPVQSATPYSKWFSFLLLSKNARSRILCLQTTHQHLYVLVRARSGSKDSRGGSCFLPSEQVKNKILLKRHHNTATHSGQKRGCSSL